MKQKIDNKKRKKRDKKRQKENKRLFFPVFKINKEFLVCTKIDSPLPY